MDRSSPGAAGSRVFQLRLSPLESRLRYRSAVTRDVAFDDDISGSGFICRRAVSVYSRANNVTFLEAVIA